MSKGSVAADQIKFINTIIDYFCVTGTVDRKMLFDKPFTETGRVSCSDECRKKDCEDYFEMKLSGFLDDSAWNSLRNLMNAQLAEATRIPWDIIDDRALRKV